MITLLSNYHEDDDTKDLVKMIETNRPKDGEGYFIINNIK
jgi:hypothetical protein